MDHLHVYSACLAVLSCLSPGASLAQDQFDGTSQDWIPAGRSAKRVSTASVEDCQAVCSADAACKGFAFQTSKRKCYLYHCVYIGGQDSKLARQMGLCSSGLAIVRKRGFVSAFKRSSFPAPPHFDESK